jgi:tetratricopeptide (TPR) repeat protein
VDYLLQQAFTAFDNQQFAQAELLYLQALQKHVETKGDCYKNALNGLAFTYCLQNKFERARKLYKSLYKLVGNQNDLKWQAITLHQLGMVERLAGNLKEAQQIFQEEYNFRVLNIPNDLAGFSANQYEQGYLYLKLGDLTQAEKIMLRALEIAQQAKDSMCIGCCYRGLGEVYLSLGSLSLAEETFVLSIQAFEQAGDDIAVAEVKRLLEPLLNRDKK